MQISESYKKCPDTFVIYIGKDFKKAHTQGLSQKYNQIFFSYHMIDICHDTHLPLVGKEMLSTYLLDLDNKCKLVCL